MEGCSLLHDIHKPFGYSDDILIIPVFVPLPDLCKVFLCPRILITHPVCRLFPLDFQKLFLTDPTLLYRLIMAAFQFPGPEYHLILCMFPQPSTHAQVILPGSQDNIAAFSLIGLFLLSLYVMHDLAGVHSVQNE